MKVRMELNALIYFGEPIKLNFLQNKLKRPKIKYESRQKCIAVKKNDRKKLEKVEWMNIKKGLLFCGNG